MFRSPFVVLSAVVALLLSAQAAAGDLKLDSREYKIMLRPQKFAGKDPAKSVDEFWDSKLGKIIADALDKRENGEARAKGSFEKQKERSIAFRDTVGCVLKDHDYSFRERTKIKNGKPDSDSREVTLKFRTPDLFVAAAAYAGDSPGVKFEEDIAPLLVRTVRKSGTTAAFARPPAMRSLFSVSRSRGIKSDDQLRTLEDVAALYSDLASSLERAGMKNGGLGAKLIKGDEFRETVFSGASVDLGHKLDAEFDLSLWYRGQQQGGEPAVAELSFKYDTEDGQVTGQVAERAFRLFKALQARLGGWANPEAETKTSLGLPAECQ
jgi:hypothetical protein